MIVRPNKMLALTKIEGFPRNLSSLPPPWLKQTVRNLNSWLTRVRLASVTLAPTFCQFMVVFRSDAFIFPPAPALGGGDLSKEPSSERPRRRTKWLYSGAVGKKGGPPLS